MGKIIILDEITANKIAAGEVVERPASVVKETVENSIDANASEIFIEIVNGGISEIRISDNGDGMSGDDLLTAPERHSTSKIRRVEDLNSIHSFGFRGEALASIAAVSKMIIATKERNSAVGNEIRIESGKIVKVSTASCNNGTTIIVTDIFYNVPARYKFLKNDTIETSHITDILMKLALTNPFVSIKYTSNKRNVFKTPGNNDLLSTIYSIFGREFSENLSEVDFKSDGYSIKGYISNNRLFKHNRDMQYISVNKRYIRSKIFNAAIDKAYVDFLVKPRYPVVFLDISADPSLFDMNVHPQKLEARFSDEKAIFSLIFTAIKNSQTEKTIYRNYTKETRAFVREPGAGKYNKEFTELITDRDVAKIDISQPLLQTGQYDKAASEEQKIVGSDMFLDMIKTAAIIGQVFKTYIILEKDDRFIMMDQHAAHERIIYENILDMRRNGVKLTQNLLEPYAINLSAQEKMILNNNSELIEHMGYEIEEFGNNTFLIRGIPSTATDSNLTDAFYQMLNQLRNNNYEPTDENIALIACRMSIKASRVLQTDEIRNLISMLSGTKNPMHCPHGRPIFHIMGRKDIEKNFQRVL